MAEAGVSALSQHSLAAPLVWQQPLWLRLEELLEAGRLPHAMLLYGTAGTGKRGLAQLLARRLLCEKAKAGLPCGACTQCQLFSAGTHPDFFYAHREYGVEAEDDGKKSKKAAAPSKQIKIDCIRAVIQFASMSAHQGGRRVVLLEPLEALNHNAANALLKVLEEPSANLYFILVSQQPGKVLATIKSRCQQYLCPAPTPTQAQAWLESRLPSDRAEKLLSLCNGAPLAALAAFENEEDALYQQLVAQLQALRTGQTNYLASADSLGKHDLGVLLKWWLKVVQRRVAKQPEPAFCQFYDQLLLAWQRVSGTANPNPRLVLESLLLAWQQLPVGR